MNFNEVRDKIASRGHWFIIVGPENKEEDNTHPRDKYNILKQLAIQHRGWPYPYFPEINDNQSFSSLTFEEQKVKGCTDFLHRKECFTLFKSNQFISIKAIGEDWIDEAEHLQDSDLKDYKPGEVLSFVSTTYSFTEVFMFVKNLVNSDLYKTSNNFYFKFQYQKLKDRTLKIFGGNRIGFSMDYKSTSPAISVCELLLEKEYFTTNWNEILLNGCMEFYKYFGSYEPNEKVIKSDINNFINRKI